MADALFNGCGYVPDIRSMQAWLELAWKAGFDTAGGDMLGNVMQGSHQWIGTTECAALLRFFGLRAEIIDFTGGPQPSLCLGQPYCSTGGQEQPLGACDGGYSTFCSIAC